MYRKFITNLLLIAFSLLFVACNTTKTPSVNYVQQNENLCEKYRFLNAYQCSFDHVQWAARSGDPNAQYVLGYLYYYGIGVLPNDELALKWITESAQQGNPSAQRALALLQPTQSGTTLSTSICRNSKGYTIQIAGSHNLSMLHQFMQKNQYHFDRNTFIFRKRLNNLPWYILAYGQYSTYEDAKRRLYHLPPALKIYQPWVKSCASLHQY